MTQITVVQKSVNSKPLFNDVLSFIKEGIYDFGIVWNSEAHRDSFSMVMGDFLSEMVVEGKIEQWKIVCDKRNNKYTDMENGVYHLDIQYKQRNCLNITQINITIYDNDDGDVDLLDLFGLIP